MQVTGKELNNYYRQIKKLLVCSKSDKKKFLCSLDDNIEEYLKEHPNSDFSEIQEVMGTPQEIADEFLANESAEKIKNKITFKKIILVAVIIVLTAILFMISFELIDSVKDERGYSETDIIETE